jgi:hypothetical protein
MGAEEHALDGSVDAQLGAQRRDFDTFHILRVEQDIRAGFRCDRSQRVGQRLLWEVELIDGLRMSERSREEEDEKKRT